MVLLISSSICAGDNVEAGDLSELQVVFVVAAAEYLRRDSEGTRVGERLSTLMTTSPEPCELFDPLFSGSTLGFEIVLEAILKKSDSPHEEDRH